MKVIIEKYQSKLAIVETQKGIKKLKDFFEKELAEELGLIRVSAPLFVTPESGLNDNLNGVEKPVAFEVEGNQRVEIVQSLAKWKRMALYKYHLTGLYTDMNAIRKDEIIDNTHSYYVDQWDWEKVILKEERNDNKFKEIVNKIYAALKATDNYICEEYPNLKKKLPLSIHFVSTQELEDMFPDLNPKERENKICKKHGAVCLTQVGKRLESGSIHEGRAPDYDDWELNGDILVYNELLDEAFELSSMGIRVDRDSLMRQLDITNNNDRLELEYHKKIVNGVLPYTIGGGIGQSRLCMFFLEKFHIGEVQSSVWNAKIIADCQKNGIVLL
jgi:aspartate--ammonia ligase